MNSLEKRTENTTPSSGSVSIFKKKYTDLQQMYDALLKAKNITDLANLYYVNAELIESDTYLKSRFSHYKKLLPAKPIVTLEAKKKSAMSEIVPITERFPIGSVVKLRATSEHYNDGLTNPIDVEGTIVDNTYSDNDTGDAKDYHYYVRWNTGTSNCYRHVDIDISSSIGFDFSALPTDEKKKFLSSVIDLLNTTKPFGAELARLVNRYKTKASAS